MNNQEIECRFLEINKEILIQKLVTLGALDKGEKIIEEIIFYDSNLKWRDVGRFVRLRKIGTEAYIAYKEHNDHAVDGAVDSVQEIEFSIGDYMKAEMLLEKIGLISYRHQQKLRHTFELNSVSFDIDTWPRIPTYVELEGESEEVLKKGAFTVGFDWKNAEFHSARWVIENKYNIPVSTLRWFTFDRFE